MKGARLSAVLISGALLVSPSFAAEGVFLETKVAAELVGALYERQECLEQLSLCDSQRVNAEEQARILEEGVRAGDADLQSLRAEADSLAGNLREVAADLSKCEESKPSRMKWYAGGVVTGVLAVVLAGLAMK